MLFLHGSNKIGRGDTIFLLVKFLRRKNHGDRAAAIRSKSVEFLFFRCVGPRNPSLKKWEILPINYPPLPLGRPQAVRPRQNSYL